MLLRLILIALGAGFLSAGLVVTSSQMPQVARFLLFLFAPLPLYVAGLTAAGATGGLLAALGGAFATALLSLIDPATAMLYAGCFAIPAVLLIHLAVSGFAWCPPGRLVVAAALVAGALGAMSVGLIDIDSPELLAKLKAFVATWLKDQIGESAGPVNDAMVSDTANVLIHLLPAVLAVTWLASLLLNLWLAGCLAKAGGRLARPWPDLASMTFPPGTPALFVAAIAFGFLPGFSGHAARAWAGALYVAYMLLGLAILHHARRGSPWRQFMLTGVYVGLAVLNVSGSVILVLIGLFDGLRPLRSPPPESPRPPF